MKRIIAFPGEKIEGLHGKDGDPIIKIDGKKVYENYVSNLFKNDDYDKFSYKLGEDQCFIMGDNRGISKSSRGFGPVGLDGFFMGKTTKDSLFQPIFKKVFLKQKAK
jgi:signal peptidase I